MLIPIKGNIFRILTVKEATCMKLRDITLFHRCKIHRKIDITAHRNLEKILWKSVKEGLLFCLRIQEFLNLNLSCKINKYRSLILNNYSAKIIIRGEIPYSMISKPTCKEVSTLPQMLLCNNNNKLFRFINSKVRLRIVIAKPKFTKATTLVKSFLFSKTNRNFHTTKDRKTATIN